MADIFGKPQYSTQRPITADMIQITWSSAQGPGGAVLAQANNFQCTYQQQVNRRYTLNSTPNFATIYPGRPQGTITIGQLVIDLSAGDDLIGGSYGGFSVCDDPAVITWTNADGACTGGQSSPKLGIYTARGCWVTSFGFQADADSLMVLSNLTVEFLQLDFEDNTNS
jgi:hypothetical protein